MGFNITWRLIVIEDEEGRFPLFMVMQKDVFVGTFGDITPEEFYKMFFGDDKEARFIFSDIETGFMNNTMMDKYTREA